MAGLRILQAHPLVLLLLPLAFVLYLVVGAVVNYRRLRQFKGPPAAGFSRAWLFWQTVNCRMSRAQYDAIQQYGSVCRIGPDLLVTDDADIVRHMNAPGSKWTRSGWYDGVKLDPRFDSVFSTRDERVHANLRAAEIGGYNGRDIATLEPDIDGCVMQLVDLIRNSYNRVPVDVASLVRFFTLDVLSTVAFGKTFGFMASNSDLWDYDKSLSGLQLMLELVVNHQSVRWLTSTRLMQALASPKETDKTGMGPVLAFARKAVAERFGPDPKVKQDMLGHFVKKGLNQLQCEVEANLQIIAGSDSTTTILRCTLFLLVGTPVAYGKLMAEIDNATANGDLSYPVATYAEAQKLPYLQACIWEGMRLFPPLFGLKAKVAPPGGETVKGIYFPEGSEVSLCDDAMCRNEHIFGADKDLFRPERWLEADAETRVRYRQTVDTIFGSGRFLCLGRHIAMIELHKAMIELMRNFDWAMADPMKGIHSVSHNVHIQTQMNLVASPRS